MNYLDIFITVLSHITGALYIQKYKKENGLKIMILQKKKIMELKLK